MRAWVALVVALAHQLFAGAIDTNSNNLKNLTIFISSPFSDSNVKTYVPTTYIIRDNNLVKHEINASDYSLCFRN